MFTRIMFATVLAFSLTIVSTAHPEEKKCTHEEAIQAETEANVLRDWDSVYRSFLRFQHCDDGAISEGYSSSIGHLLAHHWSMLSKLNDLMSSDENFGRFVIKHIDDTISNDQLKMITVNSRTHCPEKDKRLCKLIGDAADANPQVEGE